MKKTFIFQYLLILITNMFIVSCLSEGEETIALENGDAKKMILGRWRVVSPDGELPYPFDWKDGTILTFYDDDTYTDSSDEDERPHKWRFNDDEGIVLDGKPFGWDSWGRGRWFLHYPYGSDYPQWTSELDHLDDDTESEKVPETKVKEYRVSSIKCKHENGYTKCWTFDYYDNGLIKQFKVSTSDGDLYEYEYNEDGLAITSLRSGSTSKYHLQENGVIATDYYSFDDQDYLISYWAWERYSMEKFELYGYYWDKSHYEKRSNEEIKVQGTFTKEENNSNIDINPFIMHSISNDTPVQLAAFGFLGKKLPYIIDTEILGENADMDYRTEKVVRNENGLISGITRVCEYRWNGKDDTTTYTIDYEEVENEDEFSQDISVGQAVDLGLSVKWASCNVGAKSPEEYGNYYAWGETETKKMYDWSNYKWCKGTDRTLTKYCCYSSYGKVDNKKVLDNADDVAHVKWGDKWRMPTEKEWQELIQNTTSQWTYQKGTYGYLLTSDKNGNSIFLPAAGECEEDGELSDSGLYGYYWSKSLSTGDGDSDDAIIAIFNSRSIGNVKSSRCNGFTIRPVYK